MGLDAGVVRISYLDGPKGAALQFARHLTIYSCDADWLVADAGNLFVEYERANLLGQVEAPPSAPYVCSEGLDGEGEAEVRSWVDSLAWDDEVVMLHFSW